MGWPDDRTPAFYVHERVCIRCGNPFRGFASSKYCSVDCKEQAHRARTLKKWGIAS